jgi:hypothetical protein
MAHAKSTAGRGCEIWVAAWRGGSRTRVTVGHTKQLLEESESPRRSLCRLGSPDEMLVGVIPCFRMTKCAREPTSQLFDA